jgi:hypothetical protein
MDMNSYESRTRELTIDELDAVAGGLDIVGGIVKVVKTVAQIITGTTGVCTDHWYSD